jgi:hypothetical protein
MLKPAQTLENLLELYLPSLYSANEGLLAEKPLPGKWSKKEIMGHLVDSAQNNIRRFIMAQYEDSPFIVYEQDKWVACSGYQHWPLKDIIDLWKLLNRQIAAIWKNMPAGAEQRNCLTQESHTIEWLAEDYLLHVQHHLHQVLEQEPVPYP